MPTSVPRVERPRSGQRSSSGSRGTARVLAARRRHAPPGGDDLLQHLADREEADQHGDEVHAGA